MIKHTHARFLQLVAISGSTLTLACGEPAPEPKVVLRPVRFVQVDAPDTDDTRSFPAALESASQSALSFRFAGTLSHVAVKVGDRVEQGQQLARIDDSDVALKVQEARAGLAQARAQARNADASYARVQALFEHGNASQQDLDAARTAADSTRLQARSIEQQVALATRRLADCVLRAPRAGTVAKLSADVNENVRAGQAVLSLHGDGALEAQASVPETLIGRIELGTLASVSVAASPGKRYAARVSEIGVQSDRGTTFPVRVRLEEAVSALRPGMSAEVELLLGSEGDALPLVPAVAVGEDRQGRFVYVLQPGDGGKGTVARRSVTLGEARPGGIAIAEGVGAGDRVVTAGVAYLSDGMSVLTPENSH